MDFNQTLKIMEAKSNIKQAELSKISKAVRKAMPTKSADKWDDPYTFLKTLVKEIEKLGYEVSESDQEHFRNKCTNRKSDVYINVDKASQSIEFTDKEGKSGHVQVSVYNDPGKNHDYRYECNYYF